MIYCTVFLYYYGKNWSYAMIYWWYVDITTVFLSVFLCFFGKRWALFMVCQCVWNSFVPSRCRNMYRSAMVNRWLFLFNHPKYGYTQFHNPQIVWYTLLLGIPYSISIFFGRNPWFSINNIYIYSHLFTIFRIQIKWGSIIDLLLGYISIFIQYIS